RAELSILLEGARGEGEADLALGRVTDPDSERKPVLDLKWDRDLPPVFFARMEAATRAGAWQGARALVRDAKAPAVIGDPTPWIRGADGLPLSLAPGGFAQAAEVGNVMLAKRVAELAESALRNRESPTVVELFSGAGNFTVMLARTNAKVNAVESNAASCEAARANLRRRNLTAKVTTADADAYAIPSRADLALLDPPRAGARGACEAIVKAKARRVIYVSCDAATLGRDLAILEAGSYAPLSIETFEMFPDTSHVETVISLEFLRPRKEKKKA
ncbi:MAG: methyltransferase, partial [Polyangiaceae bacterium]